MARSGQHRSPAVLVDVVIAFPVGVLLCNLSRLIRMSVPGRMNMRYAFIGRRNPKTPVDGGVLLKNSLDTRPSCM